MTRFYKLLISISALLFTLPARALEMQDLTPPASDTTMAIMNYIFGDVGGLFGTGRNTVFGDMFAVYNSGMMVVGGVLVGYIILSGILKTAHEGELLGRSWSTAWIPFRAAMSMGMILPGSGGYCLVQVFVMWCALAGVGLADKMWEIASARISYGQSEVSFTSDAGQITDGLLSGMVCSVAYQKITSDANGAATTTALFKKMTNDPAATVYDFGDCGQVRVPKSISGNPSIDAMYPQKISAIDGAVMPGVYSIATNVVYSDKPGQYTNSYIQLRQNFIDQMGKISKATFAEVGNNTKSVYGAASTNGWIFAGSSYFDMVQAYKRIGSQSLSMVSVKNPEYRRMEPFVAAEVSTIMSSLDAFRGEVAKEAKLIASIEATAGATVTNRENVANDIQQSIEEAARSGEMPTLDSLTSPITKSIKGVLDPGKNFDSTKIGSWFTGGTVTNPIVSMADHGDVVASTGILVYTGFITAKSIAAGAREGWLSKGGSQLLTAGTFDIGAAIYEFFSSVSPLLMMLTMSTVAAGLTMSTYLPMLPMLTWLTAVAGYLVLLVESMVASTLWAVMHASPDGHEWSGKGSGGYMIVLGVIMRPTLMIFGFVASMVLIMVFMFLLEVMFGYSSRQLDEVAGIGPIAAIVMFCLYVWAASQLIHRSLQVITELPSGIMKWAGGGHDPLGDDPAGGGKSFIAGVMNRGESAAQASLAAGGKGKSGLDPNAGKSRGGSTGNAEAAAEKLNDSLIAKSNATPSSREE